MSKFDDNFASKQMNSEHVCHLRKKLNELVLTRSYLYLNIDYCCCNGDKKASKSFFNIVTNWSNFSLPRTSLIQNSTETDLYKWLWIVVTTNYIFIFSLFLNIYHICISSLYSTFNNLSPFLKLLCRCS